MKGQTRNRGFSLIELMIVLAIVAITTTIAVPAYKVFTTRAKITELIGATAPYRIGITEYVASVGHLPDPTEGSGFKVQRRPSANIQRIIVRLPVEDVIFVEVRPSGDISEELRTIQPVVLRGLLTKNNQIDWDCGIYNRDRRALPMKYLPSTCRNVLHYKGKV